MRERNRGHAYNLVLEEFERSGISRAVLADRLGKAPEIITRWLGTPGNWTLDTLSDLLYAISGAEPEYGLHRPHDAPAQNYRASWLRDTPIISASPNQAVLGATQVLQFVQPQPSPKTLVTIGS
jgi:hypothetical protein